MVHWVALSQLAHYPQQRREIKARCEPFLTQPPLLQKARLALAVAPIRPLHSPMGWYGNVSRTMKCYAMDWEGKAAQVDSDQQYGGWMHLAGKFAIARGVSSATLPLFSESAFGFP